ncbi:MAG: AGE family epimerase/isomerase [Prevotella stercorea]|jgi:N-acylglucosamine 2-epimerase|uniref:AGE family epimerase/isomerase n=1 Tax=Leyella stercorea TaxID=363265 RepID=UPI0025EA6932|nr:AGE family epimerase/isomerase [Prevotella sp.]MDD6496418.1 AGE family epimerase/isomerase [Leyella stercorea]MCI6342738.1 AGE family epimerase/isomerase [Prevotella sp.]MCI6489387.1 AGE family epimerase/isomerase [Prevotella sp.]MCI7198182.1 AGE family epimerase/isomerase [Prevotella sp.]
MNVKEYIKSWAESYKKDLTENIMPFWMKYGLDRENGGVYTCVDRDGSLMDTTKSVWFQGRFAFICSFAYNNVEKNQEWLDAAKSTLEFIEKHCFDEQGHMYFSVTAEGKPLRKRRYVFSETFAAIAMSEYALATGDQHWAKRAIQVFEDTQRFLATPGFLPAKFEADVKLQGHSIVMILINVGSCIRKVVDDPKLTQQIDESIEKLRKYFIHPEFKCLLETVGENGEFIDTNMTRTINPGHCIETSWFIMEEAKLRGWDKPMLDMALQVFDWSWDWGWDKQYGGIINFRDCKNLPPQDYSQDMKFWWPQCETIIASLYAYLGTGDEKYLYRHERISEWTYAHFPDAEYGEWYGYLHRDGTVAQPAKGNLYKGPFHIPRMMIKGYMLCQEILKKLEA